MFSRHPAEIAFHLAHGEIAGPTLAESGEDRVALDLDETRGALDLPDLVGNTRNYLVLRRSCLEAIQREHLLGDHETLPALLMNKKKRVHSDDYLILNPLGKIDCLDTARSDMSDDGLEPAVEFLGKFFLSASRVPADRDIFRVRGVMVGYMFSERLVDFIRAQGYTNFVFEPVALS